MNNTPHWIPPAFIYHLYPLGLTNAPQENQPNQPEEDRIQQLYPWLDHLQWLGDRQLGSSSLELPEGWMGDEVHLWAYMSREDGSVNSDSLYVGVTQL